MKKDKQQAIKKINKHWAEIVKIFEENYDKRNERIVLKIDIKSMLPGISIQDKKSRTATQDFKLVFPHGKILSTEESLSAAKIFVEFIREVGVEEVERLKILTNKGELLITSNPGNPPQTRQQVDDKYVYIKTATSSKLNTIRIINEMIAEEKRAQIIDL